MTKKLIGLAVMAIALFVLPASASANGYRRHGLDSTDTDAVDTADYSLFLSDEPTLVDRIEIKTLGSGFSAHTGVTATLRRAITTRELAATNSISERQVCLA